MPSKGVLCYSYIAVDGVEIEFSVPKQNATRSDDHQFNIDHLEVESSNVGHFKFTGRFQFIVRRDARELTKQWVDINSMTGKLEDGSMINMEQTPSILVEDLIIVYSFYDAGPGLAHLPKQHQCYVTVTKNYSDWMRDIIPEDSNASSQSLSKAVLPSAHDIGMNSMQTCLLLLQNAGTGAIKEILGRSLPSMFDIFNRISDSAVSKVAPDIIRALAITQKDSLDTILAIGARYFEFRPAKCHRQLQSISTLEDTWYFQHGAIPGLSYSAFLSPIIAFLNSHPSEIIVVHNRWDGVPSECPRPSPLDLDSILSTHLSNTSLKAGTESDLHTSISTLRSTNTRLILLSNASQVSNHDDTSNATLDGSSMLSKLNDLAANPPAPRTVLLLQCQATATNIRDVVIASVLDSDVSTSPMLATKPVLDRVMLPVLRGEVGRKVVGEEQGLVVLMNDFLEGGTVEVAVGMCKERLG